MADKPQLIETDIWARTADPTDIAKPIQDKINTGFLYGEKPPHEGHNYYWQTFTQYFVHLNQNGVPEWDTNTEYTEGALAKDGTAVYTALVANTGIQPSTDPATWRVAFASKAPDADKLDGMEPNELPISDATQTALDGKSDTGHTHSEYVPVAGGTMTDDLNLEHDGTDMPSIVSKRENGTMISRVTADGANNSLGIELSQDGTNIDAAFEFRNDGSMTIDGDKVWTEGNMGGGSGLDADKVDGLEPADFPVSTDTQTALDGKADTVHYHDSDYYRQTAFIDESTGSADAGKPIVLDTNGKVHYSMLDSGAYPVGSFTPTAGDEYPDSTGHRAGAYWMVTGVDESAGYTFTGGDLAGETVYNDNALQFGDGVFVIVRIGMDATEYYKLDGSQPLTAPFNAGGQKITQIADGTDDTDGASMGQLNTKASQADLDSHVSDTANPHGVTAAQVQALPLTGGLLTGDLTVGDGTSGRQLSVRAFGTSNSLFRLKKPDDTNGGGIIWNAGDGDLLLRRYESAVNYQTVRLDSTGNLSVSGSAPAEEDHLTRKDYVDRVAIGINQSWYDVTGARALDTVYTNDTGQPIQICVTIGEIDTALDTHAQLRIGGVIVGDVIFRAKESMAEAAMITGIVPAGAIFSVSNGNGNALLSRWSELRPGSL